jgi:hypothetical protein
VRTHSGTTARAASSAPGPVDRQVGRRERATPPGLGGAEDEDPVRLGRAARLVAPQPGHLAVGRDLVPDEADEAEPGRIRGLLPRALRKADPDRGGPAPVHLHIADHHHDDPVVRERGPQVGQHITEEGEVGLPVVRVVEGGVDGLGVEPQQPRSEPVVVAVLEHAQVGR